MISLRARSFLGFFAGVAFFLAFLFISNSAYAQQKQVQRGPQVIQEIKHDVSPPLRDMKNPYPPSREDREIENRGIHPVRPITHVSDPGLQKNSPLPLVSTTDGLSFDGVSANGYAPPDTNGSPGLTQYVQWVNVEFAVYDKTSGALIMGPTEGNTLWSGFGGPCETNNNGDVIALYDKLNNVWIMSQLMVAGPPYYQCVAVSTSSDATGSYNRYAFSQGSDLNDYPKLGVWPDAYYVTYNLFLNGVSFVGPRVCAMDGAAMRAGTAATQQCFDPAAIGDGLLPGDLDGTTPPPAGETESVLGFNTTTDNSLDLYEFHVDFVTPANSTLTGPTSLAVNAFSEACGGFGTCVPQPNTIQQLDSLGDRMMYRLAYRNFGDHEALVTSHSVTTGSSSGMRWYEIRSPASTPVVYQQGTFAPDASWRWMGSIAMDQAGDMALGYSVSSSTVFPSIAYTGRTPSDALGTMESENLIFPGLGSQGPNLSRWGDYSDMAVDPVDDCTFWYTTEYLPSGVGQFNWQTRILNFKFSGCGSTSPDFTIGAAPSSQTVIAGNPTSYTATVSPLNGFTGDVALTNGSLPSGVGLTFNPTTVTGGSGTSTVNVTTSASTPPGTYTLSLTGTSGALTHSTTVQLVVTGNPDFTISAAPPSRTVNSGSSTSYTATVAPINGFNGAVALTTGSLPAGVGLTFNPTTINNGSGTSTVTVTTSTSTTPGTYTLTLTGTSGALVHSTTVQLVVNAGPDFTINAAPPSQTVIVGNPTSYTVTVAPLNGFTGSVALSKSGLPAGVTLTFIPATITHGSGTSTAKLTTTNATPPGTYTLTLTGTSGAIVHSTTVQLVVNGKPAFTLSASPTSETVGRPGTATYTVTVTPVNGFNGVVTFNKVGGLPAGVTQSFNPPTVTGSGTSTLTLMTTTGTGTGTSKLTISGVSGALHASTVVTLIVTR